MKDRSRRAAHLLWLVMATTASCAHPSARLADRPVVQSSQAPARESVATVGLSNSNSDAASAHDESEWQAEPVARPAENLLSTDSVSLTAHQEEATADSDPAMAPVPAEPADELAPVPPLDGQLSPELAEGGLTLASLEQIALANNPTLRQAQNRVRKAEGNWIQVGLYPNPTIGYIGEEIGDEDTAGKQGGFIEQTFVTADKLEWNRAVASQDVEQARWQVDAQQLRVLNDVRIRYFEVLGAQRTVEILSRLEVIAEAGVTTAGELVEALQSPRTDVLQAEVDLSEIRLQLENAREQNEAARRRLAAVLGMPHLPPYAVAGDLDAALPDILWEETLHRLLAASPVVQSARTRVERARFQLQRERVQPISDVDFRSSVAEDHASDFTVVGVEIGIMLPLHNRNQGNIVAACAELHRAMNNVARLELSLQQRLADAFRRYEQARTRVITYRDSILPTAEESLELTTQGYQAAELDFPRVLAARQTYFEVYLRYVAALIDLRTALVEIDGLLLTGGLDDPADEIGPSGVGSLTETPKTQ